MRFAKMPEYRLSPKDLKESTSSLEDKFLTVDGLRAFLNYGIAYEELPIPAPFYVSFYIGCRVSEALALQPQDTDSERNETLSYEQTAVKGRDKDSRMEATKTVSSVRRVPVAPLVTEKPQGSTDVLNKTKGSSNSVVNEIYLFVYLDSGKREVPYCREYVNGHVKRCVE